MNDGRLSPEEVLACSVILGAVARESFEKGHGNVFEVDVGFATNRVIDACLARINKREGWTAEQTESGIRATRDKGTRRPLF